MSRRTLAGFLLAAVAVLQAGVAQPPDANPPADRGPIIVPGMHHDISPPLRSIPGALVATRKSAVHPQIKEPGSIRRGRGLRGMRLDTAVQDYPSTPTMPLPALNVPRALSRFVTVGGTP